MVERKLGDVLWGVGALVFVLVSFGAIITSFDADVSSSEGYGSDLASIGSKIDDKYKSLEVNLQENDANTSSTIPAGSDVDVRGSSQVNIIKKESPGTIKTFVNSVGDYLSLHPYIPLFIISMAIITIIILGLRFWKPGGI